jgi:membrane fusion protein (multidrug efflux system)
MKLKIALAVVIVVAIIGGLAGTKVLQIMTLVKAGKAYTPPPEAVSSAVVHEEKWQGTLSAIGSVMPAQGVIITPEIAGIVREISFEPGATVKKGDLLIKLDTSSEDAQLRALEAQEELAKLNVARERTLFGQKMVPQAELDAAEATLKQNQANADNVRTIIEKKTIRAPFSGKLGIRQVNLGQYLEAGKPIVSLQSLSPIFVDFSLPQQELARLKTGMEVRVTTDAYPGRKFPGTLTVINPDLDSATRSIGLQATITNDDEALRPGMFARAEVLLPEEQTVLVIPATSILSAPYGDSVYVITSNPGTNGAAEHLSVQPRFVRVGRSRGDFIAVDTGMKAGEKVVRSGLFKLRPGMTVIENNEIVPKSDIKPNPADS